MTRLEDLVFAHSQYKALGDEASRSDRQKVLDGITVEILGKLSAAEITAHVREVYDATVEEYAANPHTRDIVDELVAFMSMVRDKGHVLDIGCGVGRDALFMSVPDREYRLKYMGRVSDGEATRDRLPVPTTTFRVTAIDGSLAMLEAAKAKEQELIEEGLLLRGSAPDIHAGDMHSVRLGSLGQFDGIWSCTALFTHTPRELLQPAMEAVARVLKPGGVFAAMYTNGRAEEGQYDKLLASSTGRIKWFSQPDPADIADLADECSLGLESEEYSDFVVGNKVIKGNLFVAQFFRKA